MRLITTVLFMLLTSMCFAGITKGQYVDENARFIDEQSDVRCKLKVNVFSKPNNPDNLQLTARFFCEKTDILIPYSFGSELVATSDLNDTYIQEENTSIDQISVTLKCVDKTTLSLVGRSYYVPWKQWFKIESHNLKRVAE